MNFRSLWSRLEPLYGEREARAVVMWLLEEMFGLRRTDVLCDGIEHLPEAARDSLSAAMQRLEAGEPVQYVVGHAYFQGRQMGVRKGVLIPRPETEELCQWIVEEGEGSKDTTGHAVPLNVLDIGTGSGCIAVTLALSLPDARVSAWDLSAEALQVARENARRWAATVDFSLQDALQPPDDIEKWDILVSNPPYVCDSEAASMATNVLQYEPGEALFVPDDDPLRFYRAIACYAGKALRSGGKLYFEINPAYAEPLKGLFAADHWKAVNLRDDQFGRCRMLKAIKR